MRVEHGKTYKDKVSGFIGVCTGIADYISGCKQALLIPRVGKGGTAVDGAWYDVQRLEEQVGIAQICLNNRKTPGCDKQAPIR